MRSNEPTTSTSSIVTRHRTEPPRTTLSPGTGVTLLFLFHYGTCATRASESLYLTGEQTLGDMLGAASITTASRIHAAKQ